MTVRLEELTRAGWREWVSMPDLGVTRILAKLDTGAKSAALHAEDIEIITRRNISTVWFTVLPQKKTRHGSKRTSARLVGTKRVKSSLGRVSERPVIETTIAMGGQQWKTLITLIDRDPMTHRMLLGRDTIKHHFMVDPGHSYLLGGQKKKRIKKKKKKRAKRTVKK